MTLTAGSRLGPYEVLSQIGAGGMGEVWRARDPRLGRDVAIKVLPASFSTDEDRLRRFEQEARAAGVLNHPNITAVYDTGTQDGAPYVVQELLEGETLRSALAGGKLSPRRAVDYALQVAHGLAAAHEKGIVHRDLKPENLFVTRDGRVKILDFGLAKLTHQEEGSQVTGLPTATAGTEPGVVLGTLGYMSPEQVRGRPADARSDIFSFGAILYEMLSGNRAFRGDSAADTMSAILKEDPPELSLTNQNVSPGLERVIRHCLEKNPEQRFHSAHDLAFDLEALSGLSGRPASPDRSPRTRRQLRWAAVALLAVIGAGAAFFAGRATTTSPSTPRFRRVTFRRGVVRSARYAPDGQTIVYSAAWDGGPAELFTSRVGNVDSRSFAFPSSDVLAISSTGEMAINLLRPSGVPDVLARASLAGGVPREVMENATAAGWSADGKTLGVIRFASSGAKSALEFPTGKVLYEGTQLHDFRVSPRGDTIAVSEFGGDLNAITLLDLGGHPRTLIREVLAGDLAWRPDGREIWYSAAQPDSPPNIHAVDLSGKSRLVLASPSWLYLYDISADGRVLLTQNSWRGGISWAVPGQDREQEASWLDWSTPGDLSPDGKTLLFSEDREGGGFSGSVFLRKSPDEPAVRLGDGDGLALSPDGKLVLARLRGDAQRNPSLVLLPTGAGDQRSIPSGKLNQFAAAAWLPDGKNMIVRGAEAGKGRRLYLVDPVRGPGRAISAEGARDGMAISPDGKFVAARIGQEIRICSVEGTGERPLPGQQLGDVPV
ncbi:MAG TPA: protein kinase, partial [Thermoanaerobaculia bacterium]|nr:protein kinase [Thermoanaerobaculia bacterium]